MSSIVERTVWLTGELPAPPLTIAFPKLGTLQRHFPETKNQAGPRQVGGCWLIVDPRLEAGTIQISYDNGTSTVYPFE